MKRVIDLLLRASRNRFQLLLLPLVRITFIGVLLGSAVSASAQWLPTPWTSGPIYFTGTNVGINTQNTTLANDCDAGLVIQGSMPAIRLHSDDLQSLTPVPGPGLGGASCNDYQLSTGQLASGGFMIFDVCAAVPRLTIDADGTVGVGSLRADSLAFPGIGSPAMSLSANSIQTTGDFAVTKVLNPPNGVQQQEFPRMLITTTGNVGFGAITPIHPLDVSGAAVVNGGASEMFGLYDTRNFAAGVGGGIAFGGKINATGTTTQNFASIQGVKENATSGDTASAMLFFTHANAGAPAERMRIGSDGLLTIGTTGGTGTKLAVNGSIRSFSGGFQFPDGTIQSTAAASSPWAAGQQAGTIFYSTGNVGIGTNAPQSALHISRAAATATDYLMRLDNSGGANGPGMILSHGGGKSLLSSAGTNGGALATDGALSFATGSNLDVNNASNVRMSITTAGNVGIGTTAPAHTFDVAGSPVANGAASESLGLYDTRSFAAGVGGGIAFGGKVNAAGTTAQNFASIQGVKENATDGDTASAMLFFTHPNAGAPLERMRIGSDGLLTIGATGGSGTKLAVNGTVRSFSGGFQFPDGTTQATAAVTGPWATGSPSSAIFYSAGNVGIGTSSPASPLAVNGVIQSVTGGFKFPDGTTQTTAAAAAVSSQWGTGIPSGSIFYNGGAVGIGTNNPGAPLTVLTPSNILALFSSTSGDGFMRVNSSTAALHPFADLLITNTANTAYGEIRVGDDNAWRNLVLLSNGGSVGIGTTAPAASLHVKGTASVSGPARRNIVAFDASSSGAGVGGGISFGGNYSATSSTPDFANIWGIKEFATDNDKSGALLFGTSSNAGGPAERMRIDSNGLVSIGVANGTGTRLNVNGDINVTGNINAKYQDVAEWVPTAELLPAGTVVVLDPSVSNQVMASVDAYATSVAGVISDHPGIVLGEGGAMKLKVATSGRVKVKVDATKGAVHIGDLLVTSDQPGTAMKSQPIDVGGTKIHRPGTLIGKALEPLNSGKGEILVLLSLQ